MAQEQLELFIPEVNTKRLLNRTTKNVLNKPEVAISELIANSWDAGATKVEIDWPSSENDIFCIRDNGTGMSNTKFINCWANIGYDKQEHEGKYVTVVDPISSKEIKRRTFGKNGIGKFASFCFADKIRITTSDGKHKNSYIVTQNIATGLFNIQHEYCHNTIENTGTVIESISSKEIRYPIDVIREYISQRFITSQLFEIYINNKKISFDLIGGNYLIKENIKINKTDSIDVFIIQKDEKDYNTRWSGITWFVNDRAVGLSSWNLGMKKFLDGRKDLSRKYNIIIRADCLEDVINEDWTEFDSNSEKYRQATESAIKFIDNFILEITKDTRQEKSKAIKAKTKAATEKLGRIPREKIYTFIDQAIAQCPSIKDDDLENIVKILTTLETTTGKFGIIEKMAQFSLADWENLDSILNEWSVSMAKEVLDEIQWRLLVINNLKNIVEKKDALEVQELQPCMEKCLWIFGPEFESIEYTSNESIATCYKKYLSQKHIPFKTSNNRPDFTILPNAAVSFYSTSSYDPYDHAEDGIARLVIIELKAPNIAIGRDEKNQPQKYYDEFLSTGLITQETIVTAFVLGSKKQKTLPIRDTNEGNFKVKVMLFHTLLERAESRLFNLRKKIQNAPFLHKDLLTLQE